MKGINTAAALIFAISTTWAEDPLNAIIGDAGWEARLGSAIPPGCEELRIQTHLEHVADLLEQNRTPAPTRSWRRARLVRLLRAYAHAGVFPRNTDFPGRRMPYFIDDGGRVCAAGYLVEQTAGRELAEAIDRKFHNALVMEMAGLPELDAWMRHHGLTLREVAMIQPTYRWRPGPGRPPIRPWPSPVVQDRWNLVDTSGEKIADIQASRVLPYSNGLAAIKTNGKWGFIDKSGKVVIEQRYSQAEPFSEGFAVVEPIGLIDTQGNRIPVPEGVEELSPVINGLAAAMKNKRWGFVNTGGNWAIKPSFNDVGLFEGKLAAAQTEKGWGYIDRKGTFVVKPRKDIVEAAGFSEGVARVLIKQWRLLGEDGSMVGEPWEFIGEFGDGVAPVKGKQGMGLIDPRGKVVLAPEFTMIGEFSEGLAPAQRQKWERVGYINPRGKFVIGEQFNEAAPFKDGVASVRKESNWGCIDKKGDYVHQPRMAQRVIFSEGRAFTPVLMQIPPPQPIPLPVPRPVPQPAPRPGPGPV